uniref:HCP-like protein n=1 Tax=Inonotus obliquus TaxID=167356 RepID=A0A345BJX4_9AGAM|nr:HCP-like protein [Inonotus obliquus]
MSDVQSPISPQHNTHDRGGLPPNPAYLRRTDSAANPPNLHQHPPFTSQDQSLSPVAGRNGQDPYAAYPSQSLSPAPYQAARHDSLNDLADEFNRTSLNDNAYLDAGGSNGFQTGGVYAGMDAPDSRYPHPTASAYDGYAYDTNGFADIPPNARLDGGQQWPNGGYDYSASYRAQSPAGAIDPFAAAASNVLGGPPANDAYARPVDYRPPVPQQGVPQPPMPANSTATYDGYSMSYPSSNPPYAEDDQQSTREFVFSDDTSSVGSRPSLHRSATTASVNLSTRKMKAVDLSAPPYTKEFIDEYRQRIKNDPDPEAHFRYAKYLIDAARHIGANASDQRAVRKFRELLVQEALKVFRRLATQGEPYAEAQFFLANCHGTGMLGLPVDHERAYHLYLQAAKQNHSAAAYRVAVCNEIGAGTRRELPRAFAFYRKSASLGDTAAMYKLGMVLLNGGLEQPSNPREAVAWLRRAAEQADEDNPHALHELGLLHENPESKIVPYDPVYAKGLFTKAAQLGYTPSQFKLGQCYEYGTLTCPVDPRRSIGWYTKAAEKGFAEAELALSGWYLTGSEGVLKQSDSEAYLWARRAANKGLSTAEYAVGYFSETGIGVKQDIEMAKRWYMRAAGG